MKKFTAKDVFEQIDLTTFPHGGLWAFNATSGFEWYKDGYGKSGMELLESIAESLSMDGTEVKDDKRIFVVEEFREPNWRPTFWTYEGRPTTLDGANKAIAEARKHYAEPTFKYRIAPVR